MSPDAQKILDAARQLPPDQREWLAECLLIDDDRIGFSEVESAWAGEIKRRLDEIDSGTAQMAPLDDVLARMDARRRARQKE
jgi:Putative addiction module component